MRQKIIELIKNHPEFAYKYNDFLAALTLIEWKYLLKNQPKLKKIAKNFFWGNFLLSKTIDDSILAQLKFSDWDYLIKDDSFLERCRKFQEGKRKQMAQKLEEGKRQKRPGKNWDPGSQSPNQAPPAAAA